MRNLKVPQKKILKPKPFYKNNDFFFTGGGDVPSTPVSTDTLASHIGYVPANFNFLPWGLNYQASNFNADYTKTRVTATSTSGPFTTNAQKLVPTAVSSTHLVSSEIEINVPAIPLKISAIAKAAGYSRMVLYWKEWTGAKEGSVGFNLATGQTGYDIVEGVGVDVSNPEMEDLGNGWWLCSFDYLCETTTVILPEIRVDNGTGTTARSVSFTGDGTSGVTVLYFNGLPKVCWSMTDLTFEDDFTSLSTIDLGNTKAPGYKWYINNRFPNSSYPTFGWHTNPPSRPSDPRWFTLSSHSVLKIYPFEHSATYAGWDAQIWSVVTDGLGDVIGYYHKAPLIYDALVNWNGAASAYNNAWSGYAAWWGISIEGLQTPSISGLGANDAILELDVSEAVANTAGAGGHIWQYPASPVDNRLLGSAGGPSDMVLGQFRRLSALWIRPEDTGTSYGLFAYFLDGEVRRFSVTTYSTGGLVAGCDQQRLPVIFNTSGSTQSAYPLGQPFYIDWVKIYSKP